MQYGYLAAMLPLGCLVAAQPAAQPPPSFAGFATAAQAPIVTGGDAQCSAASPPSVFSDCLTAFANSALGTAFPDGSTIFIDIDGLSLSFGTCDVLIQFFNGDEGVSATVDKFSLSDATQNLLGGVQGQNCQVALTLSDSTVTGIASDFNPASL